MKYNTLEVELKDKLAVAAASPSPGTTKEEEIETIVLPVSGDVTHGVESLNLYANKDEGKKSKSQRKKEKQKEKDRMREREIEEELANAGPSQRDIEIASLKQKFLDPAGLVLKEVKADGHCLYRAISDQVFHGERNYMSIRGVCADALMQNSDEYAPFAEYDDSFESYVEAVRSTAQWGGQLEVRALAQALNKKVVVYSVEYSEPLIMGEESDLDPIRLSFHRHYYALGEHYNAVIVK